MTTIDNVDRLIWLRQASEKFWRFIAWRLPRPLVMWAVYRAFGLATSGKHGGTDVDALTVMDMLKRWDEAASE